MAHGVSQSFFSKLTARIKTNPKPLIFIIFATAFVATSPFAGRAIVEEKLPGSGWVLVDNGTSDTNQSDNNSFAADTQPSQLQLDTPNGVKWASGSSDFQNNKGFGDWRGQPVTAATTWSDNSECQTAGCSLDDYSFFDGIIDIASGGINKDGGESWSSAASGAYDDRFQKGLQAIANKRAGKEAITFVRFAHEFNGGYPWQVMAGEEEAFKQTFCRYTDMAHGLGLKTAWSPNDTNFGGSTVNPAQAWPGKSCADVVAVDSYDWGHALDEGTLEKPIGLGTWAEFAKQTGVPFAVPEWGTKNSDPSIDNPAHIDKMHGFFSSIAPADPSRPGPGELAYENYFNINLSGSYTTRIYPESSSSVPKAAERYRQLWSN